MSNARPEYAKSLSYIPLNKRPTAYRKVFERSITYGIIASVLTFVVLVVVVVVVLYATQPKSKSVSSEAALALIADDSQRFSMQNPLNPVPNHASNPVLTSFPNPPPNQVQNAVLPTIPNPNPIPEIPSITLKHMENDGKLDSNPLETKELKLQNPSLLPAESLVESPVPQQTETQTVLEQTPEDPISNISISSDGIETWKIPTLMVESLIPQVSLKGKSFKHLGEITGVAVEDYDVKSGRKRISPLLDELGTPVVCSKVLKGRYLDPNRTNMAIDLNF